MAGRTVDLVLDVDPVGKHNKRRKLIHPLPGDRSTRLYVLDDLQSLGSLADCVSRMAGSTEFDVRNCCGTVPLYIAVAEGAVQFRDFPVMEVIEPDGLVDRHPGKDGRDRIKEAFCLKSETIIGNGGDPRDENQNKEKGDPSSHIDYRLNEHGPGRTI
jgi:hypothetical protein